MFKEISETTESIKQENKLIELLVSQTTLKKYYIEKTIRFIKRAHGNVMRQSGDPYYEAVAIHFEAILG